MAIYLDEQTRPLIEKLVKDWQTSHPQDFIADRLVKALEADRSLTTVMAECQHAPGTFIGKKTCCTRCGSSYEPGMGFSWELVLDDKSTSPPNELATSSPEGR